MNARHLVVVDAAVPALVGAVIVVGESLHGKVTARPATVALGICAALVLVARRRWPGWTLFTSALLVAALFHIDAAAASVAVLAPAVALYSVALRRGRLQQIAAGVFAIAAVIAADVIHHGQPTIAQTATHALLVAVPLLAAQVIRTHQANVRLLLDRLDMDERAREQDARRRAEQERLRIARELHDVVAHTLTEINVTAAAAAETSGPGAAHATFEEIERASHDAIGELRGILGVLRGPDTSAPSEPSPGIPDIAGIVNRARETGVDVTLDVQGVQPDRISDATSLAAYRIVQESLTNARRHAPGTRASITLRFDATQLMLTIVNGLGDLASRSGTPGVGIIGMRERASVVGGRLTAAPLDARFQVRAELPYEAAS
jgi:signal transduction histidine kinase